MSYVNSFEQRVEARTTGKNWQKCQLGRSFTGDMKPQWLRMLTSRPHLFLR